MWYFNPVPLLLLKNKSAFAPNPFDYFIHNPKMTFTNTPPSEDIKERRKTWICTTPFSGIWVYKMEKQRNAFEWLFRTRLRLPCLWINIRIKYKSKMPIPITGVVQSKWVQDKTLVRANVLSIHSFISCLLMLRSSSLLLHFNIMVSRDLEAMMQMRVPKCQQATDRL